MVGVESYEVGGQESDPDEQSCHDGDENVPAFVEVVRQFPGEEPEDSAEDEEEKVV